MPSTGSEGRMSAGKPAQVASKATSNAEELSAMSHPALVQHCVSVCSQLEAMRKEQTGCNEELTSAKESVEKLKGQLSEASKKETVLLLRLTDKEHEISHLESQVTELKAYKVPTHSQLRQLLLDPAVNLLFARCQKELSQTRQRVEDSQNELTAWKFTPDSQTGKRLMSRCNTLLQENDELGKQIASGRIAQLEGDIALQKALVTEMKKSQDDADDLLTDLDEDMEGMQSTIYMLQGQLKDTRARASALERDHKAVVARCEESQRREASLEARLAALAVRDRTPAHDHHVAAEDEDEKGGGGGDRAYKGSRAVARRDRLYEDSRRSLTPMDSSQPYGDGDGYGDAVSPFEGAERGRGPRARAGSRYKSDRESSFDSEDENCSRFRGNNGEEEKRYRKYDIRDQSEEVYKRRDQSEYGFRSDQPRRIRTNVGADEGLDDKAEGAVERHSSHASQETAQKAQVVDNESRVSSASGSKVAEYDGETTPGGNSRVKTKPPVETAKELNRHAVASPKKSLASSEGKRTPKSTRQDKSSRSCGASSHGDSLSEADTADAHLNSVEASGYSTLTGDSTPTNGMRTDRLSPEGHSELEGQGQHELDRQGDLEGHGRATARKGRSPPSRSNEVELKSPAAKRKRTKSYHAVEATEQTFDSVMDGADVAKGTDDAADDRERQARVQAGASEDEDGTVMESRRVPSVSAESELNGGVVAEG